MLKKLKYEGVPIAIGAKVQRTANNDVGVVQETFGDNSLAKHPELPNLIPVLFKGESKKLGICGIYAKDLVEIK